MSVTELILGQRLAKMGSKRATQLFRQTWGKTQFTFDIEKVFWQSLYGIGFAIIAKILYHIWVFMALAAKHPDWAVWEYFTGAWWQLWASPVFFILDKLGAKPTREEVCKEIGVPIIIDDLFGKYFIYVLVAIPLLFIFLEFRRVQKAKKLSEEEAEAFAYAFQPQDE